MKKFLLVATVVKTHVNTFHIPTLKMMKEKGYEVHVASHNDYDDPADMYIPHCDKFIEIPFERSPLKLNNIKSYQKLKELFKKENYDIIHCHTPVGGALTRLAAKETRKNGTKILYTAHGFHFYKGASILNWLIYYPIEKFLSKYTDVLITINEEDYTRAKKFDSDLVNYIPGVGVDLNRVKVNEEKVRQLKSNLGITKNDFIICSVGELNKNKNHQVVLKAISKLNNSSIKYLIAGNGYNKKNLEEEVKRLKLERQVSFLGYSDDIYEILDLSDLFVFPSYREGLSKSLMEAMAMGKPIIASDIRGNRDLVDENKGGDLFDPRDYNQLVDKIEKLIGDLDRQFVYGNYNKNKVKDYSLEEVVREMTEIYL